MGRRRVARTGAGGAALVRLSQGAPEETIEVLAEDTEPSPLT